MQSKPLKLIYSGSVRCAYQLTTAMAEGEFLFLLCKGNFLNKCSFVILYVLCIHSPSNAYAPIHFYVLLTYAPHVIDVIRVLKNLFYVYADYVYVVYHRNC